MDAASVLERRKYEQMWTFAEYRDDHATAHAGLAFDALGVRRGESLIDFGAGAGYGSRWFVAAGVRTLAVDIAANALAPEIAGRVPILLVSLWDLPVDISAEWGFCCDVMEHIPTERVDDVLRNVRRSTRRDTFFSISLRPDGCGRLIGDSLHLTVRQLDWWRERLLAHWTDIRVLQHQAGESVELVASGRRVPAVSDTIASLHTAFTPADPQQPRQLNYERMAYVAATLDSARYLIEHMMGAVDVKTASAVRAQALDAATVDGLVLEFGVFDGGSIRELAARANQVVHGFDSFEGLPEDWTHFQKKGRFSRGGKAPAGLPDNVQLHAGQFDDTLPSFLASHPGPVRLAHVDCDLSRLHPPGARAPRAAPRAGQRAGVRRVSELPGLAAARASRLSRACGGDGPSIRLRGVRLERVFGVSPPAVTPFETIHVPTSFCRRLDGLCGQRCRFHRSSDPKDLVPRILRLIHTPEDSVDKLEPSAIATVFRIVRDLVVRLDAGGVRHFKHVDR